MPAPHTPTLMHTEQGPFEVVDLDSPFIFGIGRKCTEKELQQAREHGRFDEVPMSICGITTDGVAGVMGEGTARYIVHCVNTHAALVEALRAQEEADEAEDAFTAHMNDPKNIPEGPEGDAWFDRRDALQVKAEELKAKSRALRAAALATQPQL